MEKTISLTIENFGGRVVRVWEGLRPVTRSLVESAFQVSAETNVSMTVAQPSSTAISDARSEWELSRLLAALDDRAAEAQTNTLSVEQGRDLSRMAETCAAMLQSKAQSAEVFAQLFERVLRSRDYSQVDRLADVMSERLAPSETCELTRHTNRIVRAIAQEALVQTPTPVLVELLNDPVDTDVARTALERQAVEYDSEEARWVVNALNRLDTIENNT